jgi:hypothetical protein
MSSRARSWLIAVVGLAFGLMPRAAAAQWAVAGHAGVTFAPTTGFVDLDDAAGRGKPIVGASITWLRPGWLGLEGEISLAPGYFNGGGPSSLVVSSRVTVGSASAVVFWPAIKKWPLRPFLSAGPAFVRVRSRDVADIFAVDSTLAALNLGAGVWYLPSPRVGIRMDVRLLRSRPGEDPGPGGFSGAYLDYWRTTFGAGFRF